MPVGRHEETSLHFLRLFATIEFFNQSESELEGGTWSPGGHAVAIHNDTIFDMILVSQHVGEFGCRIAGGLPAVQQTMSSQYHRYKHTTIKQSEGYYIDKHTW